MADHLTRFELCLFVYSAVIIGGGVGDASRDVLYEPGGKVDLISIVFSR